MTRRVVLVAPASGELGGMETYMFRVAAAMENDNDISVALCFKRTARFDPRPEFKRAVTECAAPIQFVERASCALFRTIRGADLVHLQNYSPDVGVMAQATRTPLIVTVHAHLNVDAPLRRKVGEVVARGAVARWYNSEFTWSSWEPQRRRSTSRRISLRPEPPVMSLPMSQRAGFVFAARWVHNKGLETLIEAYARADLDRRRWPLVLLGDGPLRSSVEQRLAALGIDAQMPGYVSDAARWAALRSAKWLVAPAHTGEDLGLTPLEARSVQVPCIVTRDGGLPEAAGQASMVCTPGDVGELCLMLERAASMPEAQYAQLVRRSTALLERDFPPLSVEHPAMYRELLRSR